MASKEELLEKFRVGEGSEEVQLPVKIQARFDEEIAVPGNLLNSLVTYREPAVILEDGNMLRVLSWVTTAGDKTFTNTNAKLIAEQYNGVFFPFDMKNASFAFSDYLEALKRCMPNIGRQSGALESMVKLSQEPDALKDLQEEAKYLEKVQVAWNGRVEGILGKVHQDGKDSFSPRTGYPYYGITLALFLDGFGYRHFNVPKRGLISEINVDDRRSFGESSYEARAIKEFVNDFRRNKENFGFFLDFEGPKGQVKKVKMRMLSPKLNHITGKEESELMRTEEMLPIMRAVSDTVSTAIQKACEYRKEQQEQEYKECVKAMNFVIDPELVKRYHQAIIERDKLAAEEQGFGCPKHGPE